MSRSVFRVGLTLRFRILRPLSSCPNAFICLLFSWSLNGIGGSRAYWHHLVKSGEILAMMALTAVNIAYYQELMVGMREAIFEGRFADFIAETRAGWSRGEASASSPRLAPRRTSSKLSGG